MLQFPIQNLLVRLVKGGLIQCKRYKKNRADDGDITAYVGFRLIRLLLPSWSQGQQKCLPSPEGTPKCILPCQRIQKCLPPCKKTQKCLPACQKMQECLPPCQETQKCLPPCQEKSLSSSQEAQKCLSLVNVGQKPQICQTHEAKAGGNKSIECFPLLFDSLKPFHLQPWSKASYHKAIYSDKGMTVKIDVSQFKPDEVTIRIDKDWLVVEANQETWTGEGHAVRKSMHRFQIPENADNEKITTEIRRGMLKITIPMKS